MTEQDCWCILEVEGAEALGIVADWFEEHDVLLAKTLRWCYTNNKFPSKEPTGSWDIIRNREGYTWRYHIEMLHGTLPLEIYNNMKSPHHIDPTFKDYLTLKEAFFYLGQALGEYNDPTLVVS